MDAHKILRIRSPRRHGGEQFFDAGRLDERWVEPQAGEIEWVGRYGV